VLRAPIMMVPSGSKLHMAVATLGRLLALHVTPANVDDCAKVGRMAEAIGAISITGRVILFDGSDGAKERLRRHGCGRFASRQSAKSTTIWRIQDERREL
jgi:hypothetical protein